jgi:hypothetical protein
VSGAIIGGTLSLVLWQISVGFVGSRFSWRTSADVVGATLSLAVGFIPLFTAQGLVLRRYSVHVNSWVFGSAVGICLGTYAQRAVICGLETVLVTGSGADTDPLGAVFGPQLFWARVLGLLVLWSVVGAAQWLVLRHRIRHAVLWVFINAFAGAISGAVALLVSRASGDLLLSYLARWAVFGALTGLVLVLLLHNRIKDAVQRRIENSRRVSSYPTP